jgi:hypothetical protein
LAEVHVGQVVATPQRVILEQLEWFARDVMPAFKTQTPPAGDGQTDLAAVPSRSAAGLSGV